MSTPLPLHPDIAHIAEPFLLGHLLQWSLFGSLSVQVYIYYLAFPNDALQRKLLVYGVYAIELVQSILFARMAYLQFAAGFGNSLAIDTIPTVYWFGVPISISIVAAVVQIFYAYRIKLLTTSYVIPSVIVFLALLQLGGGISLAIFIKETVLFSKLMDKKTFIASGIWNGSSALCDVIIAAYMTYLLSQRKSTWKQTQRKIHKLMRLILETGMLTATLAIMNFVFFLIPKTTYFQTTCAILGKMYSNTMMVVLNSRMAYDDANDTMTTELSSRSVISPQRPAFSTSHNIISVTRERWSDPLEDPLKMFGKGLENSTESVRFAAEV